MGSMSTTATEPHTRSEAATDGAAVQAQYSWKTPVLYAVFAVGALLGFGLTAEPGTTSGFQLSFAGDPAQLPTVRLPTRLATFVLALLCTVIAAASVSLAVSRRRTPTWLAPVFGISFVLSFLCWAIAGETISFVGLLQGSLLLAVPLIFGAMSGVLCERSGVINIAIEGELLAGAFLAALVGSLASSVTAALIAAPIAGLLVGALLAIFTVRYAVDQIIVGVVLNVFVIGLTSFFYGRFMQPQANVYNQPETVEPIAIPLLSNIPLIGPVLFQQTIIVYLMYVTVAVVHVALFHTRCGLRVRAVGEHPEAADTVGIDVNWTRIRNVTLGGAIAGLGGAFFTIGQVGAFGEEMTAGKGFIALAALIFGRWRPLGALAAALFFGFADSLQSLLTILGTPVPSEFMLMVPYLATILAVAGLVGRVRPPAADGKPYIKS